MMIALDKGRILIKDEDTVQRAIITSWGKMRRDRRTKLLVGDCDLELMNKLAEIINLPPKIEKLRQKLNTIQNRVDEERIKENPEALYPYPVTKKLYQHQVRAANMALLTFEMVDAKQGSTGKRSMSWVVKRNVEDNSHVSWRKPKSIY